AADRTPPPAAAELFAAAESGVGLAAPPEEPVEPPAAAPSPYASTAYRPPNEAGAGVAADAGERPAWRRWVLFGVPLLVALLAGAWVVQDRFLAADDPADGGPVADEADPQSASTDGEAATDPAPGRASGLDIGDVVPETGGEAAEPAAEEAAAADEEDPFGPVTMPDGAPAPGAPGTISEITWSAEGRSTVFLIWTGGPIDQSAVRDFRLDGGNPRHVVRLLGIDQPYTRSEATVGTRQVRRLRTGLHVDREPPELHVVFDLNGGAEVAQIQARGNQVRIVVTGGAR
ncbi:MAG TPA: hypothetical protein VKU40_12550, partial [Thermoanaerobaculia bacterium]|nr:hypothetical protein [Thermoanaerobaculia bacterium]